MDYSDRHSISLHEYHERFPQAASIPTLTQQGLVGGFLDQQRRKAVRRERRRAIRRQFINALVQHLAQLWRTPSQVHSA